MERIADYMRKAPAVYGGTEPEAHRIARTYRFWRGMGAPATRALAEARNGAARYPRGSSTGGAPFGSDNLRWFERPEEAGFRFVGFCDELIGERHHKGWFTAPDGDNGETLRGAVYRLPARDGRTVYVAAYCEQGFGVDGAAAIALGELFLGERGGDYADSDHYGAHREAARRADSIAESYAEKERDYQEAWRAGSRWADLGDDIATARRDALALLKEMKRERRRSVLPRAAHPVMTPAICSALRARLDSFLETIREAREKREELKDSARWQAAAFNDGADSAVFAIAGE